MCQLKLIIKACPKFQNTQSRNSTNEVGSLSWILVMAMAKCVSSTVILNQVNQLTPVGLAELYIYIINHHVGGGHENIYCH